ncbi:hypothetical protein Tco_0054915, partial [Tanacetum coccineum]
ELAYQIDNKDSKKQDKMFYPRFTKIIIHYFLKKEAYQAKKDVPSTKKPSTNPKPTRKKAPVKAYRGKRLNVLSEVALSEAAQLKEVTKRSKKDFHISHASGSVDSGEEDDEDDNEDDEGNDDGDDSDVNDDDDDDDNDCDDDDNDDGDDDDNDGNDDDDSQFNEEHKEEENFNKFTDKEDDEEELDDGEELYKDTNMNLRKEDVEM